MRIASARSAVFAVALLVAVSLFLMPSSAQIRNPIEAARDAYNRARQQQQQQQQGQPQPQQQAPQQGQQPQQQTAPQPASAPSQPAAGTPAAGLDVVGFRPGMPIQEAYQKLKAYNPQGKITAHETTVPEIGAKPIPQGLFLSESGTSSSSEKEMIELSITLPPGPQVVYKVTRILNFQPGQELTEANALAALRDKYVQDFSFGENNPVRMWFFDQQGQRAKQDTFAQCANAPVEYQPGLGQPIAPYRPPEQMYPMCTSLIFVKAALQRGQGGLLTSMAVSLSDIALHRRAAEATYKYIMDVQAGKQKEIQDKANQQGRPKL